MDQSIGVRQTRFIIGIVIVFIVSMVNSCTELRYSVSGSTAEGRITGAQETRTSRRRTGIIVLYQFETDKKTIQKGRVTVSHSRAAELVAGSAPEVTYLPSSPETNTLTDERSMTWPIIFGVMFIALCVMFYRLSREAHGK